MPLIDAKAGTSSLSAQTGQDPKLVEHAAEGVHLLLNMSGCDPLKLDDQEVMLDLLVEAATATGATVLQVGVQKFQPQGLTAFVVLAESHASLHTYPESGVLFFDCFTCGSTCRPELSIEVLVKNLKPRAYHTDIVRRDSP